MREMLQKERNTTLDSFLMSSLTLNIEDNAIHKSGIWREGDRT